MVETSGDRLRRARKAANCETAAAAIERFGWKASTYRSHENGQTQVPPEDAVNYAAAYGVTPEWIVFGAGDPDDMGLDRMLRGKSNRLKQKAKRMIELLLADEE